MMKKKNLRNEELNSIFMYVIQEVFVREIRF